MIFHISCVIYLFSEFGVNSLRWSGIRPITGIHHKTKNYSGKCTVTQHGIPLVRYKCIRQNKTHAHTKADKNILHAWKYSYESKRSRKY